VRQALARARLGRIAGYSAEIAGGAANAAPTDMGITGMRRLQAAEETRKPEVIGDSFTQVPKKQSRLGAAAVSHAVKQRLKLTVKRFC
jgi:hypothetical protein